MFLKPASLYCFPSCGRRTHEQSVFPTPCGESSACQDNTGIGGARTGRKRKKNGGSQSQQSSQGRGFGSWREFSSEPQQDLLLTSSQNYNKRAAQASQDSGLRRRKKKSGRSCEDLNSLLADGIFLPPSTRMKERDLADRLIPAAKKPKPSDEGFPTDPTAKFGSDRQAMPHVHTTSNPGFLLSSERRAAQYKNQLRSTYRGSVMPAVLDPLAMSAVPHQPIATLMEAHESGEMMETLDEVSFALDGLRQAGGMTCVQRASALSLAVVCFNPDKRRLLRAKG